MFHHSHISPVGGLIDTGGPPIPAVAFSFKLHEFSNKSVSQESSETTRHEPPPQPLVLKTAMMLLNLQVNLIKLLINFTIRQ